jgi:hypothetical protein
MWHSLSAFAKTVGQHVVQATEQRNLGASNFGGLGIILAGGNQIAVSLLRHRGVGALQGSSAKRLRRAAAFRTEF